MEVYGLTAQDGSNVGNALVKIDVKTGDTKVWRQRGAVPGAPIFVPRPGGAEDDGAILTHTHDSSGKGSVVILDASTMEERARAEAPCALGFGFHGSFWPA